MKQRKQVQAVLMSCMQMILCFLSQHMRMLPATMLERVCLQIAVHNFEQQSVVFNAGDEAVSYYLVLQGGLQNAWLWRSGPCLNPDHKHKGHLRPTSTQHYGHAVCRDI
jgi:hypothetical protein